MKIIQHKIKKHYNSQLPFVVYNKPNKHEVFGLFQRDSELHTITGHFNTKGFVFAPFHSNNDTIIIPVHNSEFVKEAFKIDEVLIKEKEFSIKQSKDAHKKLIAKGIVAIKNNQFKKVVLSRKELAQVDEIDVFETYYKLLQMYPNAFVYVWFHPKVGLWLGATPETLVKLENNHFKTMALAGTQVCKEGEKPSWKQKEIKEQQFVTDYIVSKLSDFSKEIELSKTETVKAGALLHLRTEIKGVIDASKKNSLFSLVDLLHPTPAVCGLPKEAAKQFILKEEGYNRLYYTGFLGEINMGSVINDSHLFVNLRCMEVKNNLVQIYIGGGITKESEPEHEWQETVAKSKTMYKVL